MNGFDVAVVLVTFAVLGVAAIISGIVVPIVRFRVSRYRLASNAPERNDDIIRLRAQVQELEERRKLELEGRISFDELPTASRTAVEDQRR
jgi:hypothetical protein